MLAKVNQQLVVTLARMPMLDVAPLATVREELDVFLQEVMLVAFFVILVTGIKWFPLSIDYFLA